MSGYGEFAHAYDLLTFNVPYDDISSYYTRIIRSHTSGKRLLDMGCGTGNLTVRLAKAGFEAVGQDASSEMLSYAAQKSSDVQWICQSMTKTNVGEPMDIIISTLDSVNHLQSRGEIAECFRSASENLKTGGIFVLDLNTEYKHREILGNNTFVYDVDGVYCVWQNEFYPKDSRVDIALDLFFEEEDGSYTRGYEQFCEIALPIEGYTSMLEKAGFRVVELCEYLTHNQPNEKSEKLLIAAEKIKK